MKNRTIIIMMVLMLIALIGMVLVQYSMSYRLRMLYIERFDQDVNQSIRSTIRFLTEKESMELMAITLTEHKPELKAELDSLRKDLRYVSPTTRQKEGHGNRNADLMVDIIRNEIKNDTLLAHRLIEDAAVHWVRDSRDMDIRNRINLEEIYEVLKDNLHINGVDEPFEYLIYDQNDMLIYCSPLVASNQRIRRPSFVYSAHLFPTELNAGNASIKVIFPTMKKEQLSSNKGIWSSVIIVVLVFLIFVFSTYTIFRQRNVSQMKTDFMNNVTHELKTPMASISLASQMLQDPNVSKTPERITSLSKIIDNESRRLQVMFEKILQLSVYEKGESHLKLTDLSVNELVNSVCDTFEISLSHVGGQLIRQLDAQFDIALVDKLHFTGIIYNLLDNAVKYRSPDRPLIVYVRTSSNQEGTIQIIVEDNGLGISRSDQKRIFDRFFRVHTGDRHDVKGYGIGLTYVKHMVDMHHGTISVSSELGIGTRFTISLPVL